MWENRLHMEHEIRATWRKPCVGAVLPVARALV